MTDHGFKVGDSVYVLDTQTMVEHPGTIAQLDMGYNGHIQVTLGDGPWKVIVHPSRISPVLVPLKLREPDETSD